ncbi:hypothetical protein EMQ25_03330 [Arsenicitalea aurantiaca]|uniref:Uncharacterized protein n=1 Tax=Arsenicitalea aurantiaca TaxID=1783274 RepID=A0A433XLP0_9HYPH|nr:hypothetical protein [Arsenicitalea aurantiaca]RUT34999.1 hypothetical protein EMQ25_03330 [Arsenicitalea aurantiaca]
MSYAMKAGFGPYRPADGALRARCDVLARWWFHAPACGYGAKKRPHRSGACDWAEAKSKVLAEAREEDTPSAGWTCAEGGGNGADPGVEKSGPREEETGQIVIDQTNMLFPRPFSNVGQGMSAMRWAQARSGMLPDL